MLRTRPVGANRARSAIVSALFPDSGRVTGKPDRTEETPLCLATFPIGHGLGNCTTQLA
jgi:hypothetical protein